MRLQADWVDPASFLRTQTYSPLSDTAEFSISKETNPNWQVVFTREPAGKKMKKQSGYIIIIFITFIIMELAKDATGSHMS